MKWRVRRNRRSARELREHYDVEVDIANRLKKSTREERRSQRLYTSLYDELYRRVPHHPQLTDKKSPDVTARLVRWQVGLLKRFIGSDTRFVEVGAGDCALAFTLSRIVGHVYAVDIANIITEHLQWPRNFELFMSDGINIPLPDESVDVVYSNQLMEHIHPDDAVEQLQHIYRVLRPNGRYICITPNRINGPWDISRYFDDVARGLHLKEYTNRELRSLFRRVGFRECASYVGFRSNYIRFPLPTVLLLETMLTGLPVRIRGGVGRSLPVRTLLGIRMVGVK